MSPDGTGGPVEIADTVRLEAAVDRIVDGRASVLLVRGRELRRAGPPAPCGPVTGPQVDEKPQGKSAW
jgi:hypothetical protein